MFLIRSAVALCALSLCVHAAQAQTSPAVSNLVAFSVSNPTGNLVRGADGALYGVSAPSSSITGGLVYRATIDGSSITTLYQMDIDQAIQPQGGLTLGSDGMLYGTTRFGSSEEASTTGTVFKVSQSGAAFTVIHRFASATGTNADFNPTNVEGAYPEAELTEGTVGADVYLFGVTTAGGPNGTGAVFRVSRDGTAFDVLHTFAADTDTSTSGLVVTLDGAAPRGQLVQVGDVLYGTTSLGGANGRGTVFRIGVDGSGFEVLYEFSATTNDETTSQPENTDGAIPLAGLVDGNDGFLYGVTSVGGTDGLGVVYSIALADGAFAVLHHFNGETGARPTAELLLGADGRLYGTTAAGGVTSANAASTLGTIFSIDRWAAGTTLTRLHSFDGSVGTAPGSRLVQLGDGDFVGTLAGGGNCSYGAIFRYRADGTTYTGNDRCGRRRNNDTGGGHGGVAFVLLLGSLAWLRRKTA
ncbi:MAG TPA: choice-of-anchor tandem repeat GloVer-containing protein [Steroidobacteraceae bacterium]|nr:choice-of-anchor tandem repeat GloVer-containing protein [Steroidobacteraceae bacterium]